MTILNSVNKAKNYFNNSVEEILQNKTKFASIATYIQRLIRQYNLGTLVDIEEVFNEAYSRTIKHIEKTGNTIESPEAFLKKTSLNVIREKKRKQSKFQGVDFNSYENTIPADEKINNLFSENFSKTQIEALKSEIKKLKHQDFDLIIHSVIEEKSTKEIVKLLSNNGTELKASAVRQRKSRILRKLQKELTQ